MCLHECIGMCLRMTFLICLCVGLRIEPLDWVRHATTRLIGGFAKNGPHFALYAPLPNRISFMMSSLAWLCLVGLRPFFLERDLRPCFVSRGRCHRSAIRGDPGRYFRLYSYYAAPFVFFCRSVDMSWAPLVVALLPSVLFLLPNTTLFHVSWVGSASEKSS